MYSSCLVCGSHKIIPNLHIQDAKYYPSDQHKISVNTNPKAMLFQGTISGDLKAYVCGDCGYTAIFAEHFRELYSAYEKQLSSQNKP